MKNTDAPDFNINDQARELQFT